MQKNKKDGEIQARQKFLTNLMLMQTIDESRKNKWLKMEIQVFKVKQKVLAVHPVVKLDHQSQKM